MKILLVVADLNRSRQNFVLDDSGLKARTEKKQQIFPVHGGEDKLLDLDRCPLSFALTHNICS